MDHQSEYDGLLEAAVKDRTTRAVLADWCDDNGLHDEANFWRRAYRPDSARLPPVDGAYDVGQKIMPVVNRYWADYVARLDPGPSREELTAILNPLYASVKLSPPALIVAETPWQAEHISMNMACCRISGKRPCNRAVDDVRCEYNVRFAFFDDHALDVVWRSWVCRLEGIAPARNFTQETRGACASAARWIADAQEQLRQAFLPHKVPKRFKLMLQPRLAPTEFSYGAFPPHPHVSINYANSLRLNHLAEFLGFDGTGGRSALLRELLALVDGCYFYRGFAVAFLKPRVIGCDGRGVYGSE